MLELSNTGKQGVFDLEPQPWYGLKEKDGSDFFRVFYSGLSAGLMFTFETKEEAEIYRGELSIAEQFVIDIIPQVLLDKDQLKLIEKLENM